MDMFLGQLVSMVVGEKAERLDKALGGGRGRLLAWMVSFHFLVCIFLSCGGEKGTRGMICWKYGSCGQ